MPPVYVFNIAGVDRSVRTGWELQMTANGRSVLRADVLTTDGSARPQMDDEVLLSEVVGLVSSSVANPSVITTNQPHGVTTGDTITIAGHTSVTPNINGDHVATRISATTFSIPVNVTDGGVGGTVARRIFGGNVEAPEDSSGDGEGGGPAVNTRLDIADFNAITEYRYVMETLAAGTLKSMLTTLVANYLPTCTLHPSQVDGPALAEQPVMNYTLLRNVLDQLCVLASGYVWTIDPHKRLRAFLPSASAAPFNISNDVIGIPRIRPTRANYANRVILRYSAAARSAEAYLLATANFANNNTVTIDGKVYTFQTTLTAVDGHVKIGANTAASLLNLQRAINVYIVSIGQGVPGTDYAGETEIHPSVVANRGTYFGSSLGLRVRARTPGLAGNSINVAETCANAFWRTSLSNPSSTLQGGNDQALTNWTLAEDIPAQAPPTGIREIILDAPDILDPTVADATAAAYLAASLVEPRAVAYDTYNNGARPGHQQTIALSKYGVNATFLITDVTLRHIEGSVVLQSIVTIENALFQSADRWRETYRQWAGGGAGNAQVGAVTLTYTSTPGGAASSTSLIPFGGSQNEWQQASAGTWIDANSIRILINPTARGSSAGTMYVWLRARTAGVSVTARLRDKTNGLTAGTSAAVTSTSFTPVSFPVTLSAGVCEYGVELSPGTSAQDVQLGSAYME